MSLFTSDCLRISNSASLSSIRAICFDFSSRSLSRARILWCSGIDGLHLGQQLLVLFLVGFELAAVLLQDHLGRGGDASSVLTERSSSISSITSSRILATSMAAGSLLKLRTVSPACR